MLKHAAVDHPVHDLIRERHSPRAFSSRAVEPKHLLSLFEAARWAPSSGNEQPWSFVVATHDDATGHAALVSVLTETNQRWAAAAPVLGLSVARLARRSGKPNRYAFHDTGLALENLLLQAFALGLVAHPMGGFDHAAARERFAIPPTHEPVAAIAIGYPGDPNNLPEDLRARERLPRVREPLTGFVFGVTWGQPLPAAATGDDGADLP